MAEGSPVPSRRQRVSPRPSRFFNLRCQYSRLTEKQAPVSLRLDQGRCSLCGRRPNPSLHRSRAHNAVVRQSGKRCTRCTPVWTHAQCKSGFLLYLSGRRQAYITDTPVDQISRCMLLPLSPLFSWRYCYSIAVNKNKNEIILYL